MTPLKGAWYNPLYDGEGFNFAGPAAYFYTYGNGGNQKWYYAILSRTGDTLTGDLYETSGGSLQGVTNPQSVEHNPQSVEHTKVGTIEFVFDETWVFSATINGTTIGYPLYSLAGTEIVIPPPVNPEPPPDPDPEPEPEPENPFEGKLTFRQKPFPGTFWRDGDFMQDPDGNWYLQWGTSQIDRSKLSGNPATVWELEITALEDLQFTPAAGAQGYGSPFMDSVPQNMSAGDVQNIKCKLSPVPINGSAEDAHYQININGKTAVLFTAHIMNR